MIVFNGNYTSIIHHFRGIEVFLLAGNDVIALSPLDGTEGAFSSRILKGRPRLSISVMVTLRLLYTISEILRFFCYPETTS
jgi:hypothetical protein